MSRSPAHRVQFHLGRLILSAEFPTLELLQDFQRMYGVVTRPAPSDAVPDVEFQLVQVDRADFCWLVDGAPFDEPFSPALMRANFEWALHDALSAALLPAVTVHAAVVANPAGEGIALVGMSGSGKSTLAAGLMASGWTLFCDEFFAIEPGGVYVPMPGMVSLKGVAIDIIRSRANDIVFSPVVVDALRGPIVHLATTRTATLDSPFKLKAVCFPSFRAAAALVVTPQSTSEAFFRIAEQSHNFHLLGATAFHDLVAMARVPSFAMDFGNLDDGLNAIWSVVSP